MRKQNRYVWNGSGKKQALQLPAKGKKKLFLSTREGIHGKQSYSSTSS